jgi:hypothetical protein
MFGTHDLWLFVLSGLLLNITPGPDTLYIVGRSSTQGWRAGAFAATTSSQCAASRRSGRTSIVLHENPSAFIFPRTSAREVGLA